MDINEARRLKELERENSELKKMLAESLLKNRVLEAVCEKNCESGAAPDLGRTSGCGWIVFATGGVPDFASGAFDVWLSWAAANGEGRAFKTTALGAVGGTSALRVSADCGDVAPGGLGGGQTADTTVAPGRMLEPGASG